MSILVHLKAIVSLFILALKDSSLPLWYQLVVDTNIFVIQYSKSFNRKFDHWNSKTYRSRKPIDYVSKLLLYSTLYEKNLLRWLLIWIINAFLVPILLAISLKAILYQIFGAVHSTNVLCLMRRKFYDYFYIIEVKRGCNK